jgi:hypothetical protein
MTTSSHRLEFLGLPQMKAQSGEDMVTGKYNPRTRQWDIKKIKCLKGYDYIPVLISKIYTSS